MTTKQIEIMTFLDEKIFNPILENSNSKSIKQGVIYTINCLKKQKDAKGMVQYFWSAIAGKGNAIEFSDKLKIEGHKRFEDIFEEFRERFSDDWLREN